MKGSKRLGPLIYDHPSKTPGKFPIKITGNREISYKVNTWGELHLNRMEILMIPGGNSIQFVKFKTIFIL